MLCKLTNLFWFTQNFPVFSNKSTYPGRIISPWQVRMVGLPTTARKMLCEEEDRRHTVTNAEVLNANFVAMLPVPSHSKKKKKKRLKTTLDSPSSLSFDSSKTEFGKEFSSSCMFGMSVQDWLLKAWPATVIAQQPPALSFSRTGNVIFLSLLSARLKTYQDDLWFRLSRARTCPQAKNPRALAKIKIHLTNWALTRWGRS